MKNFVLGSGLVGRIARMILGESWGFIPFKNSRYYTFTPALADDYIICHPTVDKVLDELGVKAGGRIFYKRGFSVGGHLLFNQSPLTVRPYLDRVYGPDMVVPADIFNDRFVYGITCRKMHEILYTKLVSEIKSGEEKYGDLLHINTEQKTLKTSKGEVQYDKLVSTIPLNVLHGLMGKNYSLQSKNVYFYHIMCEKVDLEGCHIAYVVDSYIDFFKVSVCGPDSYLFWCFEALENPYEYFGKFIGRKMDIEGAWFIEEAIPVGMKPNLEDLEKNGIFCVGSNAQWDDFIDISSAANRIAKISAK